MIKTFKEKYHLRVKPEILGSMAQIALLIYLIASQFHLPIPYFLQGMLLGFAIVGNIAWLLNMRKNRSNENE